MLNKYENILLKRLLSRKVIYPHHHIRAENLIGGVRPDEVGNMKKALHSLIKQQLVVYVKKGKSAVAIDRTRLQEIYKLIYPTNKGLK